MFKKPFMYIIASLLMTNFVPGILTPHMTANASSNNTVVLPKTHSFEVNASTPNGQTAPWDHRNGFDITQKLHHGNQITYRFAHDGVKPNPQLYQAEQAAIKAWNQLKVIKFAPVANHAEVTIHTDYQYLHAHKSKSDDVNGQTIGLTSQSALGKYYNYTDITFMPALKHHGLKYQTQVAEHELGHALGFEHIPYDIGVTKTIMTPYEHTNDANVNDDSVANYFKQALQYHYDS